MGSYVLRRLLQMIPVIIGATFLIFAMVFGIGDPAAGRCGERACPEAFLVQFRQEYNLDEPLVVQYGLYMAKLLSGDFGESFSGLSVAEELLNRWPTTIRLAVIAVCFEALVGIAAGILAALRKGRFLDYLVTLSSLLIISIPVFVVGSLSQLVFGIRLGIFPVTATEGGWFDLLLPGLVLGSFSVAYIARLMRSTMIENLRSDYVRTARAKGLGPGRTVGVHTLRNSMIPAITYIGYDLGALMGGAVVTERIFNINGIGGFLFYGINTKDGTIVVGTVTCLVLVYLLANLLVDVLYGVLDPRISHD
ncbi:ABC transporter permease [Desertihabitans brevis]|uniref:ABC transporter permease n=1 Tax=Desertihabitans brevis TaxID=2268447 RepID=A0A367YSS7_9ACTN|nr:ABC transporter permease [Desertihabitans brevis]RCK68609.1 ABC transporter permease [Desertihabitans brevis]